MATLLEVPITASDRLKSLHRSIKNPYLVEVESFVNEPELSLEWCFVDRSTPEGMLPPISSLSSSRHGLLTRSAIWMVVRSPGAGLNHVGRAALGPHGLRPAQPKGGGGIRDGWPFPAELCTEARIAARRTIYVP